MKIVQPYFRTSTDDKGQDPERQLIRSKAWTEAENIRMLPPVIDEGTSGDKNPFDRPKFMEAVAAAKAGGAQAILVESQDRFTRQGIKKFYVAIYRLEEEHGLKLWLADQPLSQQEGFGHEIMNAVKAEMSASWLREHKAKVKSKLDKIRCKVHGPGQKPDASCDGKHLGRRWKPFSETEDGIILELHHRGAGWARIALELNKARGASDIVTPALRRARGTSAGAVRRRYLQVRQEPATDTPPAMDTQAAGVA